MACHGPATNFTVLVFHDLFIFLKPSFLPRFFSSSLWSYLQPFLFNGCSSLWLKYHFTEGNLQSWMLLHSPSCLWCPFSWWFELLKLIHHNKPYQNHASPIVQSLDVCFLIHLFETSFVFYHTPLHLGLAFHGPPCQAPFTNCSTAPPSSLSGIHSQYSHILVQSMV